MRVSFVVPVYNEEDNVQILFREIKNVMNDLKKDFEIIFVNDGSTDTTQAVLEALAKKEKTIKLISFRRNFGKTSAMSAALENVTGDYVITMDGDLQNDPKDVPRILEKLKEYDVVSGWRKDRKDPVTKRFPSRLYNWMARKLTGVEVHDFDCMMKGYRAGVLKDIKIYGEMHRYILPLVYMRGYSVGEIDVNHRKRQYGRSKYGFRRIFKGLLDLAYIKFWMGFSTRPLHFFGTLGAFLFLGGFALLGYKFFWQFLYLGEQLTAVTPLMLLSAMFFMVGIMFIFFGFLGEILVRTYYETTGRKPYEIKK